VIELLCILLRPALLWDSNRVRYWYLTPVALVAFIIDVLLCHTSWVILAGWPQRKEWTISQTLERMCWDFQHPDHLLFVAIARKINRIDPLHRHIKAVL